MTLTEQRWTPPASTAAIGRRPPQGLAARV